MLAIAGCALLQDASCADAGTAKTARGRRQPAIITVGSAEERLNKTLTICAAMAILDEQNPRNISDMLQTYLLKSQRPVAEAG